MPARELPHEPWALPVVPDPAPGESWSSYFTRTAALNDTTVCILENATGIRAEDTLSPHDIPAAAALVNLEPSQVHVMTLERWTGIAYRESPHLTRTSNAHRWTWNKTHYACPSCQHTGVTLLEWRLPWITTCPLHERYLTTSPAASPMTQAITQTLLFRDALQRETCDFFDVWRDAIRLAQHLRRMPQRTKPTDSPQARAEALFAATPLAAARHPEDRAALLGSWLNELRLTQLSDSVRRQLRSRLIIDAVDAVAAGWYRR